MFSFGELYFQSFSRDCLSVGLVCLYIDCTVVESVAFSLFSSSYLLLHLSRTNKYIIKRLGCYLTHEVMFPRHFTTLVIWLGYQLKWRRRRRRPRRRRWWWFSGNQTTRVHSTQSINQTLINQINQNPFFYDFTTIHVSLIVSMHIRSALIMGNKQSFRRCLNTWRGCRLTESSTLDRAPATTIARGPTVWQLEQSDAPWWKNGVIL